MHQIDLGKVYQHFDPCSSIRANGSILYSGKVVLPLQRMFLNVYQDWNFILIAARPLLLSKRHFPQNIRMPMGTFLRVTKTKKMATDIRPSVAWYTRGCHSSPVWLVEQQAIKQQCLVIGHLLSYQTLHAFNNNILQESTVALNSKRTREGGMVAIQLSNMSIKLHG